MTSTATGKPLRDVLVMGEGTNWTQTDANGRYSLPPARFRRPNAPIESPVSFRVEGYRPVTRIAPSQNEVLDVALDDSTTAEWKVSLCQDAWKSRPLCGSGLAAKVHRTIGFELLFMLPCDAEVPGEYGDIDFSGRIVQFKKEGKTYYLRTMHGQLCCGGHPLADRYLDSSSLNERSWIIKLKGRRIDVLDARGVSKDGTHWRWVGPLLGEFAEYQGADLEASKYFDAILDSVCFQSRF